MKYSKQELVCRCGKRKTLWMWDTEKIKCCGKVMGKEKKIKAPGIRTDTKNRV